MDNKQLSLIDALCIVRTGWGTEQEKELLDNAYLLIKQHSQVLHLEYRAFLQIVAPLPFVVYCLSFLTSL